MKKYIFTIAFALLGITSSMASKADTLRIYSIDGERIPNFTGKELIGKTIKNYQVNTNVLLKTQKRCDRDSYHHHYHTSCRQASPSLSDQGQKAGTDRRGIQQDFSQQDQSHRCFERGQQSHSGRRSERRWQKLHHRYSGEITDKTYPFFFSD